MKATAGITAPSADRRAIRSITRRYYGVWAVVAIAPSFIFAIYPLFLRSRGLNQFQVNTVAATYFLVTFLTDVPTGAFADAIGRRVSVVLGCGLHALAFLLYFVSSHYWHFIVAEIIDGVATTFCNGAIDAWAVDALDLAGFAGAKDRIFSRAAQLFRIGAMAGALSGAYLARIDMALPFLPGAIAWLVAGAVTFALMDGNRRKPGELSARKLAGDVRRRIVDGTTAGLGSRPVMLLAIASAISWAAWSPFWQEWQHYFVSRLHSGVEVVGWLFCAWSVAQMIGSEVAARAERMWAQRAGFMAAGAAGMALALIVAGLSGSHAVLAISIFVIANILSGATWPVFQSWYNELIEGENRATLLSFQSTFGTFGATAGLPVQGLIADGFGIGVAWQVGGLLALLQVPCYLALRPRRDARAVRG